MQILSSELELARSERDALEARLRGAGAVGDADLQRMLVEHQRMFAERESLQTLLDSTRDRERTLEHQMRAIRSLPILRVRDALLRIPVVGPVVRTTARQLAKLLS